jgi:hypothetical protein
VSEHPNYGSELPLEILILVEKIWPVWSLGLLTFLLDVGIQRVVLHELMQIIERSPHLAIDDPSDLICTVGVVLFGRLHKTESVYVAHVRPSLGPQKIKAADVLFECSLYSSGDFFFLLGQIDGISDLFAIVISLNHAI